MNYFLATESLKHLELLSHEKTLYAFDFDGTLAKINQNYKRAILSTKTRSLLSALSRHSEVAIISGRGVKDLKKLIDLPDVTLIGNHGMEGIKKWKLKQKRAQKICKKWKLDLNKQNLTEDILIEDKIFSLSLHYREASNRKHASNAIEKAIQSLRPLPRIVGGKCVYNLIPMGFPNKGNAIKELRKLKKCPHVFYIGDDDTDEDVFNIIDPHMKTVRVGKKKKSMAKYYLKNQNEVNKVLRIILNLLEKKKHPKNILRKSPQN